MSITDTVPTWPRIEAITRADGSYEALRPSTQRAWLAAGAAVARGL